MKKFSWFILICLCASALCCCGNTVNKNKENNIVYKTPPNLAVICGESRAEALRGTSTWTYKNSDGTSVSVCSDSMHPLDAKEYMTPLKLLPSYKSSADPFKAYLLFEVSPDKVEVRCWDESCWNTPVSEGENVPVTTSESGMADRENEKDFVITLKNGIYIYEVVAEWSGYESFGGTAYYSFYTTVPDLEIQSVDK